jgi:soluble lytic murein transglycosylase-like protein
VRNTRRVRVLLASRRADALPHRTARFEAVATRRAMGITTTFVVGNTRHGARRLPPLTRRSSLGCTRAVESIDTPLELPSIARSSRKAFDWRRSAVIAARLLAVSALGAFQPCMAQIYVSASSPDASVVLSNFPSSETPVLLVDDPSVRPGSATSASERQAGGAKPTALRLPAAPAELTRLIADVAAQVQISPQLLHAVIAAESSYNPRALSRKGAIGLMQLMPTTAARFGAQDPYVARQNVQAGASYLKWLMGQFQNDMELVLAAYNAGEQAVFKAGMRIPPYPETQAYVPRVLAYLRCASSAACKPA